jgi:hypothetical protein
MLRDHGNGLWSISQPHTMLGLHLGTRMSVVRRDDGGLWIHSPVRLTPSLRQTVEKLGEVRHVVCPNVYHHLYAADWAAAYPRAVVHAPARLRKKRPDLRIDAALDDQAQPFGDALRAIHIDGCTLDETVFVHGPSRTLITSDLTENFSEHAHLPTRLYLRASGVYGRVGWSRLLRWVYRDHAAARRSLDKLLACDFDAVVLAHGDLIAKDGRAAVQQTFEFLRA